MSREPGQRFRSDNPADLWITDIPRFTVEDLTLAVSNFIHRYTRPCVTRSERIERDESFIRLRQAHWHLEDALSDPTIEALNRTEPQPEELSDGDLFNRWMQLQKQIPAAQVYLIRVNGEIRRRQLQAKKAA